VTGSSECSNELLAFQEGLCSMELGYVGGPVSITIPIFHILLVITQIMNEKPSTAHSSKGQSHPTKIIRKNTKKHANVID
jgi:hypothetical protein